MITTNFVLKAKQTNKNKTKQKRECSSIPIIFSIVIVALILSFLMVKKKKKII